MTQRWKLPTLKLFSRALRSIKVIDGNLDSRTWSDPDCIQALFQAHERGAQVEIICGPDADPKVRKRLACLRVHLYMLAEQPTQHFMVVDGKHVRIEEPHFHDDPGHQLYIKHDTLFAGKRLETFFDRLKQRAESAGGQE